MSGARYSLEAHGNGRLLLVTGDAPLQGCEQAEIVEHRRPEIQGQVADADGKIVEESLRGPDVLLALRGNVAGGQLQDHLEPRTDLPYLVMQLAGDVQPFGFLNIDEALRQGAEIFGGVTESLRHVLHLRDILDGARHPDGPSCTVGGPP